MSLFVLVVRVLQLRVVEQTVEIPQLLFVEESLGSLMTRFLW